MICQLVACFRHLNITLFPVFTLRTTNQLTLLFVRQKKISAIIITSSNEWPWRWIWPFPGNHRRSKLLFWWLLVTAESMNFLIGWTYPDGTLSSTRHTEMPFDHLTVNFMLFFSAKITKVYIKIHRFTLHGYFALVTNEGIHIQFIVSTYSSTRPA